MKRRTICKSIAILFLIYLMVGSFALYASRPVPCGEVCIPERSAIHPFLQKIAIVALYILVGPTLLVLIPTLKLIGIESSSGIEILIVYFFSFVIWIPYFLVLWSIYLLKKSIFKKV